MAHLDIQRVLAPNPGLMTGAGTNTYLLSDGQGHMAVLDPGPDDTRHLDAIQAAAAPLGEITAILVTHGHLDHLPAARPLAARTGARLHGHRELPGVERPLADGETWQGAGGLRLLAMQTPGHTDDSLCFWHAESRALFTGDLVAGEGTVIVDESPGGLARYMASLERVQALGASTIYPGHGPRVEYGAEKIAEYLAHRRQREDQVLGELAEHGSRTVDDLVQTIYLATGLTPALAPMAARNVRATLDKLRRDGRVVTVDADRWGLPA